MSKINDFTFSHVPSHIIWNHGIQAVVESISKLKRSRRIHYDTLSIRLTKQDTNITTSKFINFLHDFNILIDIDDNNYITECNITAKNIIPIGHKFYSINDKDIETVVLQTFCKTITPFGIIIDKPFAL